MTRLNLLKFQTRSWNHWDATSGALCHFCLEVAVSGKARKVCECQVQFSFVADFSSNAAAPQPQKREWQKHWKAHFCEVAVWGWKQERAVLWHEKWLHQPSKLSCEVHFCTENSKTNWGKMFLVVLTWQNWGLGKLQGGFGAGERGWTKQEGAMGSSGVWGREQSPWGNRRFGRGGKINRKLQGEVRRTRRTRSVFSAQF